MITKSISTPNGECTTTSVVSQTDNGQTVIHVVSELDGHKHEHRTTIGSEDGHDAVSTLSADQLKAHLQKHLDETRNRAAKVLAARMSVKKIAEGLV